MNREPFSPKEAQQFGAKGGASPKRKKTLEAKKLMRTLLMSSPTLSPQTVDQLRKIGVDTDNPDLTTNAAILSATILQKAFGGDPQFVRMAFEMGGIPVDIKGAADIERLKIEREKLKLLKEDGVAAAAELPMIVFRPPEKGESDETDKDGGAGD